MKDLERRYRTSIALSSESSSCLRNSIQVVKFDESKFTLPVDEDKKKMIIANSATEKFKFMQLLLCLIVD